MVKDKTCPNCTEVSEAAAISCRSCGHDFGSEESPAAQSGGTVEKVDRRKVIAIGVVTFVLVVVVGLWARASLVSPGDADENFTTTTNPFAHIDPNQAVDEPSADTNDASAENSMAVDAEGLTASEGWSYSDSYDRVRGGTIYRASVDSENSAYFDFPYSGGSTLSMTIRSHPQYGEDVIFSISKGQFVCGIDDCSGTINFGSGPESIALSEPTDNSSDTLFASNDEYIIERLRNADKVTMELPFYQEGNRQFIFHTKGLVWPPKGAEAESPSEALTGEYRHELNS